MIKRNLRIFDGHNDSLMVLNGTERSFLKRSDTGHFDLVRAAEGNFGGGIFAIFVPPPGKEPEDGVFSTTLPSSGGEEVEEVPGYYAEWLTDNCLVKYRQLEEAAGGRIRMVTSYEQLVRQFEEETISVVLHFEGAEAIRPDLSNLEHYYAQGLRSLGLVWSRPNAFGHGVDFAFPGSPDTGPGLTDAGFALVRACNRLGIAIDLSHLNEEGFWDVARTSTGPLIASHSCMHHLCPTSRNLTDRQLAAIKASNGVVGINFAPAFLRADGKLTAETPISEIIRHLLHGIQEMGVDHVALGSDFDGVLLPKELGSVAGFPKILDLLAKEGLDRDALIKIAHGNWVRVLGECWEKN
jgi:membrane dipeptidase